MIRTTRARRGATLVEVMVAAAMLILGMWLLVWLYQQGMASFLQAKGQADLTTGERLVATVMQRDLSCQMFLEEDRKPNRGRRLSDQRTDLALTGGWTPPRGGYFWARSRPYGNSLPNGAGGYVNNPNNWFEAIDTDGFTSSRSTDHALQFTVIVPGGPIHQMLSSEVPAGTGTQWFGTAAEVTYALVYSGRNTPGPNPVPLYDLVRRQRLSVTTPDLAPAFQQAIAAGNAVPAPRGPDRIDEVMTVSNGQMRTLGDLTLPVGYNVAGYPAPVRLPEAAWAIPSNSLRAGEDRLMSNVISMEIKFKGPANQPVGAGAWPSDPNSVVWPRPLRSLTGGQDNPDYPYDFLPYNGEFDTFSARVPGWQAYVANNAAANHSRPVKPINIVAISVRLRAYDLRNQNARQTTIEANF
jgi:hypothetical protein